MLTPAHPRSAPSFTPPPPVCGRYDSVEERFGFVLLHTQTSEADLIKRYSSSGGGGGGKGGGRAGGKAGGGGKGGDDTEAGTLTKAGFRRMVRSLGGDNAVTAGMSSLLRDTEAIQDSEVDEVFDALNGGIGQAASGGDRTVDATELSAGFAKLRGIVRRKRFVDAAAKAAALRKAAKAHEEAAAQVTAQVAEEKKLEAMREGTVSSRLGDLLHREHITEHELDVKFDSDGSGKINEQELADGCAKLGFVATPAQYKELFRELDADRSGSLVRKELFAALKKLLWAAQKKKAADEVQMAVIAKAQKAAEKAQLHARALKVV